MKLRQSITIAVEGPGLESIDLEGVLEFFNKPTGYSFHYIIMLIIFHKIIQSREEEEKKKGGGGFQGFHCLFETLCMCAPEIATAM